MQIHDHNITTLVTISQAHNHLSGYSHNKNEVYNRCMIKILHFRKKKKLSLAKLSALTGISEQQLNRLEKGERRWNKDNIEKISNALGCTAQELIGSENISPINKSIYTACGKFIKDVATEENIEINIDHHLEVTMGLYNLLSGLSEKKGQIIYPTKELAYAVLMQQ